jgi:hypothetical protein
MGRASWLRGFLILLLVLAAPLAIYWFGYAEVRVAQKQRQFYLTLAAIGEEVRQRLAEHEEIAANAVDAADRSARRRGIAYLGSRFGECVELPAAPGGRLRLQVDQGVLELRTSERCGQKRMARDKQSAFLIPVTDLIPWDLVERDFEGLVVLERPKGTLVAQDRRLPAQSIGQPVALYRGDDAIDLDHAIAGATQSSKDREENAEKEKGSSRDWLPSLQQRGDDVSLRIAGTEYLVFLLPVRTPVGAVGDGVESMKRERVELVLGGLVQKQELRRHAVALGPLALARFATGVAMLFLIIPFLKLRFIGRHERMRPVDVWLLGTSLLVATALGLLAVLHQFTLVQLRDRFDEGLARFAATVSDHVEAESGAALLQLQTSAADLVKSQDGTIRGSILSSGEKFAYPSFEVLFTADTTGKQRKKWAPGTIPTPIISVADQPYFVRTLWSEPVRALGNAAKTADRVHSKFASIVAPTSGLEVSVFAMRISEVKDSKDAIVGLVTPFLSVHGPAVPQPYQFVLLDDEGLVTYRAARGPIRNERFLSDAVEGGYTLLAAARANKAASGEFPTPGLADYRYRGSVYRMIARRLPPPVGGTMVAFYEKAAYESLALQIFATSLLFGLGTVGAILLGAAAAYLMFGRGALEWAWPSARRERLYVAGICAGIGAAVVMIAARSLVPAAFPWLLWLLPGLVMVALGLPGMRQWIWACRENARFWPAWQPWHFVVFGVVVLGVFMGVPIGLVFDDVFRVYATAYEQTVAGAHSHEVGNALRKARRSWVKSGTADLDAPNCSGPPGDDRCRIPGRIYASAENYRGLRRDWAKYAHYASSIEVHASLDSNKEAPVFTAGFAHFLADRSQRGAALVPVLEKISRDHEAEATAGFAWSLHPLGLLGAAGVLLGLFLVIRSVSRHVLGLDVYRDGVLDGAKIALNPRSEEEAKTEPPRRWLLLRPPEGAAERQGVKDAQCFDLRDPRYAAGTFTIAWVKPTQVVMFEHLEARIGEPEWRKTVLRILEQQPPASDVVLVSEIDPFHYLTQRVRERTEAAARCAATTARDDAAGQATLKEMEKSLQEDEAELAAWAVAMRGVEKVRYAMPEERVDPDASIEARLETECGWSAPMLEIRQKLLDHHKDLLEHRPSEVVQFVLDAAAPYYQSLWNLCSQQEKLVLIHLAHSGLVNPKNVDLVRRLAHRRLVRVDPSFQLICESFREFVRTAEPPERVSAWERAHPSEAWSRIGVPLYALAAILVAILFATQQTLVTTLISVATGSVGSITAIRNLIASARTLTGEKPA